MIFHKCKGHRIWCFALCCQCWHMQKGGGGGEMALSLSVIAIYHNTIAWSRHLECEFLFPSLLEGWNQFQFSFRDCVHEEWKALQYPGELLPGLADDTKEDGSGVWFSRRQLHMYHRPTNHHPKQGNHQFNLHPSITLLNSTTLAAATMQEVVSAHLPEETVYLFIFFGLCSK